MSLRKCFRQSEYKQNNTKKSAIYAICCMGKPNNVKEKHLTANSLLSLVVLQPKSGLGHRHTHTYIHTHTHTHTHTTHKTRRSPLKAGSANSSSHYLHNTQQTHQTNKHSRTQWHSKRRKIDALNSTAIGVCNGLLAGQN